MPKQFLYLLEHITETQSTWNPHLKKCEYVTSEDGNDIFVTFIKPPAMFISGRVFVDARYMFKMP